MRMGESQRKKLKIKNGNYQCIFCGGFTPANTVDHVPPKIIFKNKSWPEGFEFPACEPCNNGTSDDDLVVGLLARMTKEDSSILGILKNIKGQHPQLLAEMLDISEADAKVAAEKFHIEKPEGMTYRELGIVNVTDTMNLAVTTLASKLNYPNSGELFINANTVNLMLFIVELHKEGILSDSELRMLSGFTDINQRKLILIDTLLIKINNDPQRIEIPGQRDPLSAIAINTSNIYNEIFKPE
jgi:hypothetical protein